MDKSKYKEIFRIALPAITESLVAVIIATIDTKMISVLGEKAISAVSLSTQPKLFFLSIFFALGTAVSVFVAQAFGENNKNEANKYLHIILKFTLIFSLILGVILFVFAKPVMLLCNRQMETIDMSVSFFRIVMGAIIFQASSIVINSALRGVGKTKITLISNITYGIVDIIFNYLLIEGRFGFPSLGIKGNAIATVLGAAAACIVGIFAIIRTNDFISFKGMFSKSLYKDTQIINNIRNKASHLLIENIFVRIGFLLSSILCSFLMPFETAMYSVGLILLNYSFAFGDGLGNATISLVGKSVGAKRYNDLKEYIKSVIFVGIGISLILSIIYISCSKLFFGQFFESYKAVKIGFITSIIAAVLSFFQILRLPAISAMKAIGEVKEPRRIATVCVLIINPLTSLFFAFVLGYGMWGLWISAIITQIIWFLVGILRCKIHVETLLHQRRKADKLLC